MIRYAEDNGTIYRKKVKIKDELGVNKEIDKFDYYVPNDPDEYRIIFIDHVSEISQEQGLSLCIEKYADGNIRYHYCSIYLAV